MNKTIFFRHVRKLIRKIIIWALTEPGSSIPLWDDLDFMGQYRAKNLPAPVDANDVIRLADLNAHRNAVPIDHPLRSITRDHLEYPTEDVALTYLASINKVNFDIGPGGPRPLAVFVVTSDSFADKAVKCQCVDGTGLFGRWIDVNNWYEAILYSGASTADFQIRVNSAGTLTTLASEAVDIGGDTRHLLKFSVSGSTLKGYRNDMTTAKISVTDTTHTSGAYGVLQGTGGGANVTDAMLGILLAPSSSLPHAKAIVEAEIEEDKPSLAKEFVEINKLTNVPDFLRQEAKRYELLKQKGFTDEEIKALLGYIPQHQVDLASVSWGVFDHKPRHNTMLIVVTSDNPYMEGAIDKQVEYARSKNLKVLKPPRDYVEAIEQYRELKKDFPEWIAGKDNYAYQVLGHEVLELFQVADTYYGNIVDGIKPNAYRDVPDWEMRRVLYTWMERLKKVSVLVEERNKHLNKLEKVLRLGW